MQKKNTILLLVLLLLITLGALAYRYFHRPFAPAPDQASSHFTSQIRDPKADLVKYVNNTADKPKILELLRTKRYRELTELLQSIQGEFEKDERREYIVNDSFDSFNILDTTVDPLIEEWRRKFPNSYCPLLAAAVHHWALGWGGRGSQTIGETSGKQLGAMEDAFTRAAGEAQAALRVNPKLINAYTVLITITNAQGEAQGMKKAFDEAQKQFPESLIVRAIYMSRLTPRWGGSYAQMQSFASESSRFAAKNPALNTLRGYMDFDMARILKEDGHPEKAISYSTKALSYGDYWCFLEERGEEYLRHDEYKKALADLNLVLKLRPNLVESLVYRAFSLWRLGQFEEARREFAQAATIDPASDDLIQWRNSAIDTTIYEAFKVKKDRKSALASLNEAVLLSPGRADTYFYRGSAQWQSGNIEEAHRDLKNACSLGNANGCAQLQKLEKKLSEAHQNAPHL